MWVLSGYRSVWAELKVIITGPLSACYGGACVRLLM